ncbi:MAG: O-antigen polymerase [Candidatus Bathyarchaeia archaeon]
MVPIYFYGAMFLVLLLSLVQSYNFASPLFLFSLLALTNLVGVINHSNLEAAWAVLLTAYMSYVGAFLVNLITGFSPKRELKHYKNLPLLHNSHKVTFITWLIFIIYIIAAMLIFSQKGIPIFSSNVYEARIAFRAGSGLLFRVLKVFSSLLGMILVSQIQLSKHLIKRMSYLGLILVLLIISFLSGDKLSIIMFAGPMMWLYVYLSRSQMLLVFSVICIIILTVVLTQISHGVDWRGALEVLLYRGTSVQTVGLSEIFRAIRPTGGEYMRRDLQFLAGSFGLTERPETIDAYLYRTIFGYSGFTAPPTLTGELYVNWGWWGVVLGSLLYGVALQLSYIFLLRSRKSTITMTFLIYIQFMLLYMSQFATIIMTLYFLGIGLLGFSVIICLIYLWLGLPRGKVKLP